METESSLECERRSGLGHLSIGVEIPSDYVTKVVAILAKRDSGKTVLATKLEEQLEDNRLPWVALDVKGAHTGIRTHYPVVILGGRFADIEIKPSDGKTIADLIVDQNLTCVIDMSGWTDEEMQLFAADFGDRLYLLHVKNPTPRHIFLEEADVYVPQKTTKASKESLKAFDRIVRRGRQEGLGVTMISQRPAVINKDVLTQADIYFFLNLVAEQDIKVVDTLLKNFGVAKEEKSKMIKKIMKFKPGDCLMVSTWLNKMKNFKVVNKISYHMGQTANFKAQTIPKFLDVSVSHLINKLNQITGSGLPTILNSGKQYTFKDMVMLALYFTGAMVIIGLTFGGGT